jgi:mannose-6-phosphate isomerase class I
MKNIEELVNNYPTKHKEGFVKEEIEELLKQFPDIHKDKFDDALCGITCMVINGELVIYHCDIIHALYCGLENRDLKISEWD